MSFTKQFNLKVTQNLSDIWQSRTFVTFLIETVGLSTGKIEQNRIYELNGKFNHHNFFSLIKYNWLNLIDRIKESSCPEVL